MFPRHARLPRALFTAALTEGQRLSSPHFSAVLPHTTKGYAVVVSKKVARLAVTRHRMKRQALAALRTLSLPPALVLFPRASARFLNQRDVQAELAALLARAVPERS